MPTKKCVLPAIMLVMAALVISGCASPTPTPQPTIDTPEKVITAYWQAIDRGDYDAAYDLAYPVHNVTRQQWIDHHRIVWGENGTNIRIYNMTITHTLALDLDTFPGNFTGIESVAVYTEVEYCGKNTTGTSQFAAVKTDDGWKYYGNY